MGVQAVTALQPRGNRWTIATAARHRDQDQDLGRFSRSLPNSGILRGKPPAQTHTAAPQLCRLLTFHFLRRQANTSVPAPVPSNATLVCRDVHQTVVGQHTLLAPGLAAAVRLTTDAPNPGMGTGHALVLDGRDVALLRAEIVDAQGRVVVTSSANITFSVVKGPGRVLASHNGDRKCHSPNQAPWHAAFGGMARGIVQVTKVAARARE